MNKISSRKQEFRSFEPSVNFEEVLAKEETENVEEDNDKEEEEIEPARLKIRQNAFTIDHRTNITQEDVVVEENRTTSAETRPKLLRKREGAFVRKKTENIKTKNVGKKKKNLKKKAKQTKKNSKEEDDSSPPPKLHFNPESQTKCTIEPDDSNFDINMDSVVPPSLRKRSFI